MLKVLDVEGAVDRDGTPLGARRTATGPTTPSATRASPRCAARAGGDGAASAPTGAASCARCRRSSTTPTPQDCGRCSVCAGPRYDGPLDERAGARGGAASCARARWCSSSKKMAPDAETGAMRKICPRTCVPRRAARSRGSATAGGTRWCRRACAAAGSTTSSCGAAADLVRAWGLPVAWVAAVPSRRERRPGAATSRAGSPSALGLAYARAPARGRTTGRRSARWPTPPSRWPTCAAPSR